MSKKKSNWNAFLSTYVKCGCECDFFCLLLHCELSKLSSKKHTHTKKKSLHSCPHFFLLVTTLQVGLGSSGVGNGNSLQYSYLGNPTDRGPWWAIVHGAAKSQTRLSEWCTLPVGLNLNQCVKQWAVRKRRAFPGGKNLPAMQETQVQPLGQEDSVEKEMATHKNSMNRRAR